MIFRIALICPPAILGLRERAASVYWAPTSFTPRIELPSHGGGPTHGHDSAAVQRPVRAAAKNDASAKAQTGEAMNDLVNDVPKFVTQARASFLLGIPPQDLRRISDESGLGHVERAGNEEELYFTYDELRKVCQLAFPAPASH